MSDQRSEDEEKEEEESELPPSHPRAPSLLTTAVMDRAKMTDDTARGRMRNVREKAMAKAPPKHRRSERKSRKRPDSSSGAVASVGGEAKKARKARGGVEGEEAQKVTLTRGGRITQARKRLGEDE